MFSTVSIDDQTGAQNSKTERILMLKKNKMSSSLTPADLSLEMAHSLPYTIRSMRVTWILGFMSAVSQYPRSLVSKVGSMVEGEQGLILVVICKINN